jgi:tetratricopeptide (TPR) repeat protein
MRRWIWLAGFWLCSGVPPAQAATDTPNIVDLFYDLQFTHAFAEVQKLEAGDPQSPVWPFYISVSCYQRYLLEDPPRPETFKQFEVASATAFDKAKRLEKTSPAISHYYQGAVLGFQARTFIAQGHYAAAIPKARQAVAQLKQALGLDPTLEDAKLGLGLYYYFLDRIPPAAKPFAYLMIGMWGDRAKGLALLKEVSEKGGPARREAESILAAIYASQTEQQWGEAVPLFKELMDLYPHDPRYRLHLAYVYQRQGLWDKSLEVSDPEGPWIKDLDPMIQERAHALARYRAVENHLFAGRWPEAVVLLDRLESGAVPPTMEDWVALRRGNTQDAQGRRPDAAAYYNLIKNRKARGLAEVFLKTPFPDGPRDVMPNQWPLSNIPLQ